MEKKLTFNASTTLPYDPATVTGVFTDEAFLRAVGKRAGGVLESVTLDGEPSGAFTMTVVRTLPTERLPEMARKFVGGFLALTQVESWSAPGPDGSREARVEITVKGVPVNVTAVQQLVADGAGTRLDVRGDVTSSIPFMGSKIAAAAEPMVSKALNMQSSEAQRWLESR